MSWSRTQSTVALSSCEAELYALVEAAKEAMFLSSIVCEIEEARSDQTFELMIDASSTMALMKREGLGKLKRGNQILFPTGSDQEQQMQADQSQVAEQSC